MTDLSPLRGLKLNRLDVSGNPITDLAALKGMPLTHLFCNDTGVTDLSPLKGMPLKELACDFRPDRDAALLRDIKTLDVINYKPAEEFWKDADRK